MQCFIHSPLHFRLRVTHALSYGDKGHLNDCACMRRGPSLVMRLYYVHMHRLYSTKDKVGHETIAQLSGC